MDSSQAGSGLVEPGRPLDASALRDWAHTAVGDLITHIDEINRLNVFPVADSDTGVNMLFTMRSALAEANTDGQIRRCRPAGGCPVGGRTERRARQLRSDPVPDPAGHRRRHRRPPSGEQHEIDAALLGAALHRGVDLVVASMGGQEVPGTIVSVLKAAGDAVERAANAGEGLPQAVTAAGDAAVIALEKTPEQLDVLGEAGVVDAGGRGLLVLLDALRVDDHRAGAEPQGVRAGTAPAGPEIAAQPPAPQFEVMYLLGGCDTAQCRLVARAAG